MKLYNCIFTTNRVVLGITEQAVSEDKAEEQALKTLTDEFGISLDRYSIEVEEV